MLSIGQRQPIVETNYQEMLFLVIILSVGQRQPSWVETETNRKCYFKFIFYNTFSCAKTALWRDKLAGNVTLICFIYNTFSWAKRAHCRDKLTGNVTFCYNISFVQ